MSNDLLSNGQSKLLFRSALSFVIIFGLLSLALLSLSIYDRYQKISQDPQKIEYGQNADGEGEIEAGALITQMEEIEKRADSAVTSAELILSFLEGATVLLGIIIGAAALYGFNQFSEIRKEVDEKLKEVSKEQNRLRDLSIQLAEYSPQLAKLDDLQEELQQRLQKAIEDVVWIIQANQEFALRNIGEAMYFTDHILGQDKSNPLALYIAGWLKINHAKGKLREGIDHFADLVSIINAKGWQWATAQASYGVALRRLAQSQPKEHPDREKLLWQAFDQLSDALGRSFGLKDYNNESYWGPVGGIWRDMDNVENAINAYQKGLQVTPRSSYPQGNLAALYLRQTHLAHQSNDKNLTTKQAQALDAFIKTKRYAEAELALKPYDYFHLMDVAMACLMINEIKQGQTTLNDAIEIEPANTQIRTSLKGWNDLINYCPPSWENYETIIKELREARAKLLKYLGDSGEDDPELIMNESDDATSDES